MKTTVIKTPDIDTRADGEIGEVRW